MSFDVRRVYIALADSNTCDFHNCGFSEPEEIEITSLSRFFASPTIVTPLTAAPQESIKLLCGIVLISSMVRVENYCSHGH